MEVTSAGLSERRARWTDLALLQVVVLVWSLTAILGKLIALEPAVLVLWRTLLAAVSMGALTLCAGGTLRARPGDAARMTAAGLLLGLHWCLFFLGGRVGAVSVSLAGLATIPLWVALLEPLLVRGRRWSRAELALAAGVLTGVGVIRFSDQGLLTGILAALTAALLSIVNGRLTLRHPARVITFYEMTGALAFCAVVALATRGAPSPEHWLPAPSDWPPLLTLSLLCTVFAFSLCVKLQQRISAFSLGMATNLEPVYGMAMAPLLLGAGETQTPRVYLGAAIIIGCAVIHGWLTTRGGPGREEII